MRSPACSPTSSCEPLLAELTPEHFYDPLHRELRAYIVDGAAARRRRRRAARRARRARRARGDRREHRHRAPAAAARAGAAARAAARRRRAARRAAGGAAAPARAGRLDHSLRSRSLHCPPRSPVAQLAEHSAVNRRVVGSSPTRGASLRKSLRRHGRVFMIVAIAVLALVASVASASTNGKPKPKPKSGVKGATTPRVERATRERRAPRASRGRSSAGKDRRRAGAIRPPPIMARAARYTARRDPR